MKIKEKNQNYFIGEKSVLLWSWASGAASLEGGGGSEATHFCFQDVWTARGINTSV